MKKMIFPCLLSALIALTACDADTVYKKNDDSFPQFRWEKGREVVFTPEIEDAAVPYDVFINFRHVHGFQFGALTLSVTRVSPSGAEESREFEVAIIDNDGDYLSECALDICDLRTPFETGTTFAEAGKYTYRIAHLMAVDPLPNVMEVGLTVRKAAE